MSPYNKAAGILSTLHHINRKYKALYCYPSQKRILHLLKKYHKTKIAIATINRWLRAIEDEGLIKRKKRSKNDKKLGKVFQSTMYEITKKGYNVLMNLGVNVWKEIKKLINGGKGNNKKKATGVRVNGDGFPLITYQEYLKTI